MKSNIIIDKKYTDPILDWLLSNNNMETYLNFSPGHKGGKVIGRTNIDLLPKDLSDAEFPFKEYFSLCDKIKEIFGLPKDLPIEDNYGFLIAAFYEGHYTHPHKDPNVNDEGPDESKHEKVDDIYQLKDKIHCRLNILLQKPIRGGNPINNFVEIEVKENEPWMVLAGLYEHGSSVVEGDRTRIMLSFGHYLPIPLAIEKGWYNPKTHK